MPLFLVKLSPSHSLYSCVASDEKSCSLDGVPFVSWHDLLRCISKHSLINSRARSVEDVSEFDHSGVKPPVIPVTSDSSGYKLGFSLSKPRTLALYMWNKNVARVCSSHGFHLWCAKSQILLYDLEWQAPPFFFSFFSFFFIGLPHNNQRASCDESKRSVTFQITQSLGVLCSWTM